MDGHITYQDLELAWRLANESDVTRSYIEIRYSHVEPRRWHSMRLYKLLVQRRFRSSEFLFLEHIVRDSLTVESFPSLNHCLTCFRNFFVFRIA